MPKKTPKKADPVRTPPIFGRVDSIQEISQKLKELEKKTDPIRARLYELESEKKALVDKLTQAEMENNVKRWETLRDVLKEDSTLIDVLAPEHLPVFCSNDPYDEDGVGFQLCPRCTLEMLLSGNFTPSNLDKFVLSIKVKIE